MFRATVVLIHAVATDSSSSEEETILSEDRSASASSAPIPPRNDDVGKTTGEILQRQPDIRKPLLNFSSQKLLILDGNARIRSNHRRKNT